MASGACSGTAFCGTAGNGLAESLKELSSCPTRNGASLTHPSGVSLAQFAVKLTRSASARPRPARIPAFQGDQEPVSPLKVPRARYHRVAPVGTVLSSMPNADAAVASVVTAPSSESLHWIS